MSKIDNFLGVIAYSTVHALIVIGRTPRASEVRMSVHEHLEFRHLKYIIAIAEAGTFTAAALRLHVSQSTLSTQIRDLEDKLGIEIFNREQGTALTPEGRILIRYGMESLQNREYVVLTLQAIRAGTLMPLRLGFTPFVDRVLLRSVTELYRELLLNCDILPESDDTEEVVSRVRQNSLDAAIVTLPIAEDDLQVQVIERERLVVCMRSDDHRRLTWLRVRKCLWQSLPPCHRLLSAPVRTQRRATPFPVVEASALPTYHRPTAG
jgi:DNA-binding transcriptional LysR family regulator